MTEILPFQKEGLVHLLQIILSCCGFCLSLAPNVFAENPRTQETGKIYQVTMITWRGETDAEKGFLDELSRQNCPVSIQKYHADQSTEKLNNIIRQIKKQIGRASCRERVS
jgi:hypothetical protein